MLSPPEPAPERVMDTAALMVREATGAPDHELASVPIPVHRMRLAADTGGWDPALPLVAWAIPIFSHGRLTHLAVVRIDGESVLRGAGEGTELGQALHAAAGVAATSPGEALLRMVETPGLPDAFWVEWDADTFVLTQPSVVMAAPAFVDAARLAADELMVDGSAA